MKKIQMNKSSCQTPLKIIPYFLIIWLVCATPVSGVTQQIDHDVVSSGGETLLYSNFSLEFVVGEIVAESLNGSGYSLTQGFLQGTVEGTGINVQKIDPEKIIVYPNPAIDYVYMNCNTKDAPMGIDLRDIQGQLISSKQFLSYPTLLDLTQLHAGVYTITFHFADYQPVIKKIIKK